MTWKDESLRRLALVAELGGWMLLGVLYARLEKASLPWLAAAIAAFAVSGFLNARWRRVMEKSDELIGKTLYDRQHGRVVTVRSGNPERDVYRVSNGINEWDYTGVYLRTLKEWSEAGNG